MRAFTARYLFFSRDQLTLIQSEQKYVRDKETSRNSFEK
jgi:hypothetical protein